MISVSNNNYLVPMMRLSSLVDSEETHLEEFLNVLIGGFFSYTG